jgi:hypothetical protein
MPIHVVAFDLPRRRRCVARTTHRCHRSRRKECLYAAQFGGIGLVEDAPERAVRRGREVYRHILLSSLMKDQLWHMLEVSMIIRQQRQSVLQSCRRDQQIHVAKLLPLVACQGTANRSEPVRDPSRQG